MQRTCQQLQYQLWLQLPTDTGLDGQTFFTGSRNFKVKEIEVFEITNETTGTKSCLPGLPELHVSETGKRPVNPFF
jgi:hypothetical protein